MNKIILMAAIAAALTLSCNLPKDEEDDGETNGGVDGSSGSNNKGSSSSKGGGTTETHDLVDLDDDYFSYLVKGTNDQCEEGGVLESIEWSYENTVYYSIDNNILTLKDNYSDEDTLLFKGTSNDLIGTWTRTKDKAASCKEKTQRWCREYDYETNQCLDYEEETYYSCKENYDITKAVIAETTVQVTRDECRTDEIVNGSSFEGTDWKEKAIDCNTVEIYKGSEKITWRETRTSEEISYKGKSCKYSPSKSQKEAACREAWNKYHQTEEYWEDYYWDILYEDYSDCLKRILPAEFFDDYGKVAAKPAANAKAKAKFSPLFGERK
ncbi:hypothetical protein R83H12_02914 [Fibrobacteria bacterium R8-3-H12]